MVREAFQYIKQVGYVLSAREGIKVRYFCWEKKENNFVLGLVASVWENKGQINMDPESAKRFVKKEL